MIKIILSLLVTFLFAKEVPYSLDKFKPVLNVSKLQAPTSHFNPEYSRKYGDFKGYSNKYFYLENDKYMTFYMCGKKHRSELRFKKIWKVSTQTPKILEARVKIFPLNTKREFTFLQIHADSTIKNNINKPLLRIVWRKFYHHKKNHLWAIIRTSPDVNKKMYKKIDLGPMPKNFFDIKIEVKNNTLKIYLNNKEKVNMDVSYWNKYYNYFKAGVYLQSKGCAKALFSKLNVF